MGIKICLFLLIGDIGDILIGDILLIAGSIFFVFLLVYLIAIVIVILLIAS